MMPTRVFSLSLLLCCAVFFTGCSLFKPVDSNRPDLITKGKRDRPDPTGRIRSGIVDHAGELLGIKYKYGGNKPRLDLPRVSRDQAVLGRVKKFDDARPGDLVFYRKGRPSKVFHVSIVVDVKPGQLWVVHATSSRGVMREDILASSYWKPKIYQVRDVLN
jgi:cell wall-associated NlpC family hydrolase